MERVLQLLQANACRQALVRLWVLASDDGQLNEWEQHRAEAKVFDKAVANFSRDLETPAKLTLKRIQAAPLALIRALDEHVATTDSHYNRATRFGSGMPPRTENGKDYWLVPVILQARRLARVNRQAGYLGAWFHRHVVLPARTTKGLRIELSVSQGMAAEALARLWEDAHPSLKVWIGHFNDGADVDWGKNAVGNWRTRQVLPREARDASLLAAVQAAADAGAQVVVFPEFTLDLHQREILVRHLRRHPSSSLLMVVAGSFHEEMEGGKVFNTAPLYSTDIGEALLTHRKLRIFGNLKDGAEQVSLGDSVHVLVTPVGSMTVLICKDFIDAHPKVSDLLTEVPVDWALVPSFGEEHTIGLHMDQARALARIRVGTNSVVAQTFNTTLKREPAACVRGFGHAGGHDAPGPQVGLHGDAMNFDLLAQEAPRPSNAAPVGGKPGK